MPVCRKKRGDWANTKATYKFGQSKRIDFEDIIDAHQKQTAQRASSEKIILAIQDTSDFNFTHHPGKTWEKGFGLTCATLICQRIKSPFHHGIHNSRSTFGNFRAANMDERTQKQEEEKEASDQPKYSQQGK